MKACRFFAWIFALVFCPLVAFAAINPLAPTLNPTIPANTEVGYSYVATYTFTNNFPIPTPFSISVAKQVGTVFTVVNHCPSVLTVDRVCRVNITFQPAATGANLIQLTMAYLGGQTTTLPAITTTVAPLTHSITGSIHPNLPTSGTTIIGQPYSISFKYKNVDSVPVTPTALLESGNGWTDFVPTSPAPDNACSTSTPVEPTRTCVISGVFTPTSAIAYTLTSTFNYGAGGAAQSVPLTTSTTAVASNMAVTGSTTTGSAAVSAATPFTLTFTNAGNVPVTDGSLPGAPTVTGGGVITDYDDSACLHPLTVPGSCTITGNFTPNPTPTPPRDASVSIVYTYDGSSKTATSTANFTVEPVGVCNVTGTKTLALPLQTYQYGDNVVKFVFTDHCTLETVKMGTVSITSPDSSTTLITTGNDACSNFTFTGSQKTCAIYASVVPGTPGSALTVTASAPYTVNSVSQTPASASTTSTINANDPVDRMITVVNQCPFNVWMTFDGGSIIHPGTTCTGPGSTPCPTGAYCNTSANACFWSNPTVPNQDGELVAPSSNGVPSTMNITIPEDNGDDIPPIPPGTQIEVYNGGIKARLGCTGTGTTLSCSVNNCPTDSTGLCLPGSSIGSPPVAFNAVELTFNKSSLPVGTTDGVYDNQIIDGINVPMEIKGRGPFDTTDANNPPYHNCPASGAIIQPVTNDVTTQFGGCTFNLVGTHPSSAPDLTVLRYVTPDADLGGTTLCNTDSDCTENGDICGLGYQTAAGANQNLINKMCGALQGYVTVNKGICSQGSAAFGVDLAGNRLATTVYDGTFHCDENIGQSYEPNNLYACSSPINNSCYNSGGNTCCGCADWWDPTYGSIIVPHTAAPSNQITPYCSVNPAPNNNTDWQSYARPVVQWVKTACPTDYVYPYDDKSSSFNCTVTNEASHTITSNYQVTFCPGGATLQNPAPTPPN